MNSRNTHRLQVRRMVGCLLMLQVLWLGWVSSPAHGQDPEWQSLFDGKTLDGWKATPFGGPDDEVSVKDGTIILDFGTADLSGVTWTRDVLRMNYEIALQAMRVEGMDFFCGLTFPVRDTCCSLIVGGWGGSLVGISSFEDLDASENETTRFMDFENERWYAIRVRVTQTKIRVWIDDKLVVDAIPGERRVSVRAEVELSQPLGLAAWHTKAALRDIRLRPLRSAELEQE